MARYAPDHKAKTREHLIETARREFREQGFDSASIDRLMKAAGLTRGGFYAHFDSKEALVEEVLRLEPGLLGELRAVEEEPDAPLKAAERWDAYLDPKARSELIYCPLVAHAVDSIRGGETRRAIYTEQVTEMINSLEHIMGEDSEEEAVLLTVLGVGAAILSSAFSDKKQADRMEEICRAEIRKRLQARVEED